MSLPRRRLSELLKLYELEPRTRDLFVEGPTDKAVLEFLLGEAKPFGTAVRWIDEVELDLDGFGGPGGCKARVQAMASLAEERHVRSIVCVADRNRDSEMPLENRTYLHLTVFPDLEFHLADGEEIGEIVALATGKTLPEGAIEAAVACANVIYLAMRLADREADDAEAVPIDKSVSSRDGSIEIDLASYMRRMDSKNGTGVLFAEFEEELGAALEAISKEDGVMYAEFHWFEACLQTVLRLLKYSPRGLYSEDWLGRLLRASMRHAGELDPFLSQVIARMNT